MAETKTVLTETELNRVKELYRKFEKGDEKLMHMKAETGIMVVGKSNIGKTTLCHLINKSKLKVVDNMGIAAINLEDPNSTEAKIGMQLSSCTDIPNHFIVQHEGKNYNIYDCPGLCDSNKFESLISNSYYVYNTFLNIPKNLFVLVIPQEGLTGGAASGFIESVKLFLNYFEIEDGKEQPVPPPAPAPVPAQVPAPTDGTQPPPVPAPVPPQVVLTKKKIKVEEIAKRTLLVFTKARLKIENIINHLEKTIILKQKNSIGEFTKFFQSADKIEVIKEAQQNQGMPTQNVLQKISKMTYLDRNKEGGKVDMDIINYKLAENELEKQQIELAGKAFSKCTEDILTLLDLIFQALSQIKNNYLNDTYKAPFLQKWQQAFSQISSDLTKKNTKLTKPNVYPHFSVLKLFKKVYTVLEPLNYTNVNNEKMQAASLEIITAISQLFPMAPAQFEIVQKFIYLVSRKYEQIKVLSQIKTEFDTRAKAGLDKLRTFQEGPFEDIEKKFTEQFEVKPGNDLSYYNEAIEIADKYKENNKELLKKIGKCQMEKGDIKFKESKWLEAVKGYIEARATTELYHTQANQAHYVIVDQELNRKIADILFSLLQYKSAAIFYKVVSDSAMVLECYNKMIREKPQDSYNVRIQMGDYLITILQNERAIMSYKAACDSTSNIELKLAAQQKMVAAFENTQQNFAYFKARQTAKEIYNRLPADFDMNKMLAELQAAEPVFKGVSSIFKSELLADR